MKKLGEIIKPFARIIFGAILLLYYLNWLSGEGTTLFLGIFVIALAAIYICAGILTLVINDKLPKPVKLGLDIASVIGYALFVFAYFLVVLINTGKALLPGGWVIAIIAMVGAIGFAGLVIPSFFKDNQLVNKLCIVFAGLFGLGLVLAVLFAESGNPRTLGSLDPVRVIIYLLYANIFVPLMPHLSDVKQEVGKPEEEKPEEGKPEEKAE